MSLIRNKKTEGVLEKIQILFFCFFVCTLCLDFRLNQGFLIISLCISLFLIDIDLLKKNIYSIILLSLPYILALCSTLYSSNYKEATFVLEKQMTLLILPIFIGCSLKGNQIKFRLIIWSFLISIFCVCSYLLLKFYNHYHIIKNILSFQEFLNLQLHHQFSSPLNMHATYLSIYVCFSIASSIYILFNSKSIHKMILILFLPIYMASLIILSSRIIFVPLIIIFFVLPFYISKKSLFVYLLLLVASFTIGYYTMISFKAFETRFKTDTLRELNIKLNEKNIFDAATILKSNDATRAERWKCAIELIQEKPFLGYGTGDEKIQLSKKYTKYKLTNSLTNNFDSHNQYLAFMIKSGIFGLIAYLILIGYSIYISIKNRNYYHFTFILIISITSLTENILESNKGILFFAFFNSFFTYCLINHKSICILKDDMPSKDFI